MSHDAPVTDELATLILEPHFRHFPPTSKLNPNCGLNGPQMTQMGADELDGIEE